MYKTSTDTYIITRMQYTIFSSPFFQQNKSKTLQTDLCTWIKNDITFSYSTIKKLFIKQYETARKPQMKIKH